AHPTQHTGELRIMIERMNMRPQVPEPWEPAIFHDRLRVAAVRPSHVPVLSKRSPHLDLANRGQLSPRIARQVLIGVAHDMAKFVHQYPLPEPDRIGICVEVTLTRRIWREGIHTELESVRERVKL